MREPTIHDADNPDGRPATDQELAALLGGMTTLDGTSILNIYNDTRDQD